MLYVVSLVCRSIAKPGAGRVVREATATRSARVSVTLPSVAPNASNKSPKKDDTHVESNSLGF